MMDERPDSPSPFVLTAVFLVVCCIATVASWSTAPPEIPDPPVAEAPTITLTAQIVDGQPTRCLPGWTLVSAEPVWMLEYFPGRGWATTFATEDELRAAYTASTGRVNEAALAAAQGRLLELARMTCRYTPLLTAATPRAD